MTKVLNRVPTIQEIAKELELSPEEIIHAEEAAKLPHSIHETVFENDGDPITLLDQIAEQDNNWFDKLALQEAIQSLGERERLIVYLRFYKDQTQSEVSERLGISQVQVSRLEKNIGCHQGAIGEVAFAHRAEAFFVAWNYQHVFWCFSHTKDRNPSS